MERAKQVTMGELNSIVGVSCAVWQWGGEGGKGEGVFMA